MVTIEVPRSLLVREPWTTMTVGGTSNTRPMVVSLTDGNELLKKLEAAAEGVATFRVVDGEGPCYEFAGRPEIDESLLTVNVESELKFLR